jgi:hypothetical protein
LYDQYLIERGAREAKHSVGGKHFSVGAAYIKKNEKR